MHANHVRTCSRNSREENPSNSTSDDFKHLKRSSLSSVNDPDRKLTEGNSHWLSYQEHLGTFTFSNRFDAEDVEWYLNQPLDIIDGRTCLHIEVIAQRDDKLSSLLALGGSPNVRDITCGQSPLHYACADKAIMKRYNILKVLLNYGGDLYQRDDTGKTPLSVLRVVDNTLYTIIIQKYLCASCTVDEFKTVERLHETVQQHGPLENFKKLYNSLSHDDSRITDLGHHTLLFRACKVGWIDGVSFLLSKTEEAPHPNHVTNETPLHAACEGNHYKIVVELIVRFPELLMMKDKLPYRGWYPIHTACAFGASDGILEAILLGMVHLMETNDDYVPANTKEDVQLIDELGRSPLYIAVKCGNLSHIQLMTSPRLFNTLQQYVPSLYAITSGSLSQVSVIHCAVAHNRKEILHVLLDKFPLAIEVSAYSSVFVMTRMLTHLQRSVNGLDVHPVVFPLLETTICESNNGKLSLLSTSKALEEYSILSNMQLSSLAMAAAMGNEELTETLLKAGAKDDDSLALRIAMFLQHHEIVIVLLTATDDTNLCLGGHKKLSTFSLPSTMLNNFRTIDLQHNCLDCVPLALFQCPALEVLNISNNQLTELPVTDISSSNVFALSSALGTWKCRKLRILDISCNSLETLPAVIWKLPELEQLHVQRNSLTSIETVIEVCARLEIIDVSHNDLQNAPECVFRAKTVNVSHNQLKCLPTCIWYIEYLSTLRASNNQIAEITFPKSSCSSSRDRKLSFTSRGRRKISAEGNPSFFIHKNTKGMNESYSHGLIKLDLSHNKLTNFPTDLPCFANNLQRLHISGNNIPVLYTCFIPPCIKHLEAQECNLDWIETIYDNQEHLCCHKTHTTLNNLLYLYLKGNTLQQFTFINDSHDAGEKDLRFPELKTLDLSKNQLNDQLDPNIGLQKHLTTLILSDNANLKSLPLELSYLSDTLANLELDNLPGLKDPPKEYILVAFRSPKRLLSYMKSRIKSSERYRMLDLIIVGGSKCGKTSLMKSLNKKFKKQKFPVDKISIYDWEYSPPAEDGPDVVFKMWDFPSQEYDTTVNYCFYSKQALYLAIFNLTDDDHGVKELDIFLKNIKAHAPGCPVVIIGTHLDAPGVKEDDISEKVYQLYSDNNLFPAIAGVCCISNTKHINGSMKALRQKIYSVAMNLHTNGKNKLTLKVGKPLDDPDALLQQYIPKSYMNLQSEVEKKSSELKQKNLAPLMHEKEFHQCFCPLFEDREELASAVQFLHSQRILLHFEDCYLDAFYFLDLQWIFNTMANIIRIPDSNGMILNDKLIAQSTLVIPESLQSGFLALLAKFDFAIPCNDNYLLVYGLLPKQLKFPMQSLPTPTLVKKSPKLVGLPLNKIRKTLKKKTNTSHSTILSEVPASDNSKDDHNINTTNSTNIMDFTDTPTNKEIDLKEENINDLPDGFVELNKASTSYKIPTSLPNVHKENVYHPKAFPQLSIVNSPVFEATSDLGSPHDMPSFGCFSLNTTYSNPVIHPNLCRIWLTSFVPDGFWPQLFTRIISDNRIKSILSILLFTALKNNDCTLDYAASSDVPPVWKLYQKGFTVEHEDMILVQLKQVSSKFGDEFKNQIELTVHICEIVLVHKTFKESESHKSTENVIRLATSILVLIEQHILDIGEEWFPGVICCSFDKEILSYVPCSSCLIEKNSQNTLHLVSNNHKIISFDGCKAVCFSLKDLLVAYAGPSRTIKCPLHNEIHVQQLAPDMCFKDLDEGIVCGPDIPLKIDKDKELGKGGHALVLRGEVMSPNKDHQRKLVAVKIITDELQRAQNFTDFLNSYTTSVKGYRMIRKEVTFLSTLCHQNLTQLCGVSTHPFMLLMELAPLGSLGSILKHYRAANQVLTPILLQASMYQVASAMAFLHEKHVVYLDLKSDNVLVWKYPIPGHQNTNQDVLLKITDYGISRICGASNGIRNNSLNGTPGFIAPEVLVGKLQDLKSDKIDVFSFGMFLYELITLLKPFELRTENPDSLVRKGQRPQIPENSKENFTPLFIQEVMKACWNQDPMERPSMEKVVKWSQLPELLSLRIQYHLKPARPLSVGQCVVLRDHMHQYATNKPSNIQFTIPNAEHFTSLFSALTPKSKRKGSTTYHHSQVWIAQENEDATNKLIIFTFRSSDLGYYVHEGNYIESKVLTMENVGNYMWVNTNDYRLHVIHTASMKTVACVTLKNSMLEVLQLLHVPEWHMVLVLWELSEIWCIHDEVDASGLHVIGTLQLDKNIPINKLCKVTLDSTTTEVWATKTDRLITVLAETASGCCECATLQAQCTANSKLATLHCNLITCLQFRTTDSGNSLIHIWISFDKSPQLICYNGETKNQLHSVSLQCTGNATSLLGHKNHLYVGTSTGTVEVFESESGCFLQMFSWHAKVTALLKLPQEIKQCICAECSPTKCVKLAHHRSFQNNLVVPKKRVSQEVYLQRSASGSQLPFTSKSYKSGLYSTQQSTLLIDSPLIVSIGNDLADNLSIASNQPSMSRIVELLTWTGVSTII